MARNPGSRVRVLVGLPEVVLEQSANMVQQAPLRGLVLVQPAQHIAAKLHVPAIAPQLDDATTLVGNGRLDVGQFDLGIVPDVQFSEPASRNDLAMSRTNLR